jgi:putative acetyltransferase
MIKSIEGNFDHPEVNDLLKKHFIELRAVSPAGSTHVLDIPGLKIPTIKFWSLWKDSKLMGCGALKFLEKNHGEFKSIRVHNDFRNQGNGIKVINHLIEEAIKLKIEKLSIETGAGKFFEPARKLFKSCGFEQCGPFAHYKEDINSLYFTKIINNIKDKKITI